MSALEWIALNSVNGLGPVSIKHLADRYGSAEEVFKRPPAELRRCGLVPEQCCAQLSDRALFDTAQQQIDLSAKLGVTVLTLADESYPAYLREIFAPPPVLFVKGDVSVFSGHGMAVVGTRMPTAYGKDAARNITRELVGAGLVIVSGLARGIDTVAHQTCIDAGGRTVAVLGCGIDQIGTLSNKDLAPAIMEHGAVVSEFPMATPPLPYNFPRRNRIISGLSAGVLVVEGGERSGALITAHYALQQGRDIFAVPGPITSSQSMGTFNLIRDGAIPARSGREVAEALSLIENPAIRTTAQSALVLGVPLKLLNEAERAVYDRLSGIPQRIDELAEATGRTVMQLFDVLLNLELKGMARLLSGGQYVRP